MTKAEVMAKVVLAGEQAISNIDWNEVANIYKICNWTWGGEGIPDAHKLESRTRELMSHIFRYSEDGDPLEKSYCTTGRIMVEVQRDGEEVRVEISLRNYLSTGYN